MKNFLHIHPLPPAFLLGLMLLILSCSSEKNTRLSVSYHDMTSRYNALFIAKEHLKEIEQNILESQIYNYDEISTVFPPLDSVTVLPYQEKLDQVIEKAGLIIQFHGNSHYVDDAYLLIGKARYYKMQLLEASETLRFVNGISEDDDLKHEALIFLMRVYMADNKMSQAEEVADYLKRQEILKSNLADFYLTQAAFYQKRGDLDNMVPNLAQASPLLRDKKEVPRINFMLAQVYQKLGFDAGAYESYRLVWKNSRDYRQSLYARLYMQQVAQLSKGSDLEKARKFYNSMLKEGKNEEFQDRILLEMGAFEQRNGYPKQAKKYYERAVDMASNSRMRALAYLANGELAYEQENYLNAKLYYDSVMLDLPPSFGRFAQVRSRADALTLFANAENTIIARDSLLQFADLDEETLLALAQSFAEKAAEAFEEERRKLAERQAREAKGGLLQNLGLGASRQPGGPSANWYFYNSNAFTQGQLEFKRVWGNRQLQDNWRRSSQGGVVNREQTLAAARGASNTDEIELEAEPGFDKEGFIADFISMVPRDMETRVAYVQEVEVAMFEKARTLRYEIQNLPMAWKAYEAFIQRFPDSEFLAEALYSMTLLADDMGNPTGAEKIRERILNEFPNSLFALAIINPAVMSEDEGIVSQIKEIYANAYRLYESGLYLESKSMLQSAFLEYPPTEFSDRLRYLELMNISKTDNEWLFRQSLSQFLADFPDSDLLNNVHQAEDLYAQRRLDRFLQVQEEYKISENAPFYLMIAFPQLPTNKEFWVEQVVNVLNSLSWNVFIRDSYAQLNQNEFLLIISGFDTWEQALGVVHYMKTIKNLEEIHQSNTLPIFAIDNINFERFYNQKDVQEYLRFFNENYLKQ